MRSAFSPVATLLLLVLAAGPVAAAPPGVGHFSQGVTAYQKGSYARAIEHFEAARRAGLSSPSLLYNLGVAHYRLGHFAEARAAFRELATDPRNSGLAHYNLGLIDLRQDRTGAARDHFRTAFRVAGDDRIQGLAQERLAELREKTGPPSPAENPFNALVSVELGFSDNVTLAPDDIVSSSDTDDWLLEGLAAATFQALGDHRDGLQVKASAYSVRYADLDGFDQSFLRAGPEWDMDLGPWATDLAAYHDWVYLDGETFERVLTGEVDTRRTLSEAIKLRLRYRLSRIEGAGPFDYLSGARHRLAVEGQIDGGGPWSGNLGYEIEFNDREDLSSGQEFTSASPTRHDLSARVNRAWGPWRARARAEIRFSHYPDPDVTQTATGLEHTTREDTRLRVAAGLSRKLPWWGLHAFGEYEHTRNGSNIEAYHYRANVYSAGLERIF